MKAPRSRHLWAGRFAWIWAVTLLILCLLPAEEIPDVNVPLADKWVHFVMFGVQAFLSLVALKNPTALKMLRVAFWCAVFGLVVEVLQLLTARWLHRAFDTMDILADAVGVVIGVGVFILLQKTLFRNNALPA